MMLAWLSGLGVGYLLATLSESALHRSVGHASPKTRRVWQRLNGLGAMLSKAHYGHAIVHHGKTFRTDHVTQFQGADEQASLDRELTESGHASFVALRYGLITNFLGSLNYAGGPIAVSLGLSFLIYGRVHPSFLAGACLPIVTTPALSIYIHPYLHLPRHLAHSSAPILVSWILRSAYGDWARRHHYVHHRQPSVNFNLLPGGDYLFGTYRKATDDELVEMRRIGLLE